MLARVLPTLEARGILCRGPIWRLAPKGQPGSLVSSGVEAVDHLLLQTQEHTVNGVMGVEPPDLLSRSRVATTGSAAGHERTPWNSPR